MKKFMYFLLSLMVCASFCLCGCADKPATDNEIYFVEATITHSFPSNYVFVFNYVYKNNDVYDKEQVRYDIWFDNAKKSTIACIDANVEANSAVKYITPYTSLISEIHIDASFINQHKTLTVQYYVRNKAENDKIDCALAQKTFKISDLLSKVTDIPY